MNAPHKVNTFFSGDLESRDSLVFGAIRSELGRQRDEIELIASENIVSRAVLEAQGSIMTNKYAEGYSGRRYYGGCQFVDIAEDLAIERAVHCSIVTLPMFSPIRARKPIRACFRHFYSRVTRFWGCLWMRVVTSPMGRPPTSRANGLRLCNMACASKTI